MLVSHNNLKKLNLGKIKESFTSIHLHKSLSFHDPLPIQGIIKKRRRQVGAPGAVDVPGFVLEARLRAAGGGAPA